MHQTARAAAAAGELVVDKLPGTPSRLAPRGIIPRLAQGALAGGLSAQTRHASWLPAAALGASSAAVAARLGHDVRARLARQAPLEDWAPSGHRLLVTRTFDRGSDLRRSALYAMAVDSRRLRRLTSFIPEAFADETLSGNVASAVWSPDGRTIAFLRRGAYDSDIYTIAARSRSPQGPHAWHKIIDEAEALHDWQPLR